MTSILLINDNKIVSRLLQLSSEKNGYNLKEVTEISKAEGEYDVVFIDSENYSDALMGEITANVKYSKLGYIGNKQETSPDGFDLIIEKPFLPTDFVDMIKEQVVPISLDSAIKTDTTELDELDLDTETELLLTEDTLDLDNLDEDMEELLLDEELEEDISLDDLSAELSTTEETKELDEVPDDFDLSLDSASVMTTGIAASMAANESAPEELADMVNEIDGMENDLELTDEPSELSLELEEDILDEIEPLEEEVNEEINMLEEEPIIDKNIPLEVEKELDEFEDSSIEEVVEEASPLVDVATGIAAAVAVGAAATAINEEPKEESLNLDDFESLSESDMQTALGEEVMEEIISEEITTDGEIKEEGMVEMDDMQAWIKDAVQKAITPEMIQEALNGMDININLTFSSKKEDNTPS